MSRIIAVIVSLALIAVGACDDKPSPAPAAQPAPGAPEVAGYVARS